MNDPLYSKLKEAAWRGKLSPAEEAELRAWLVANPQAQGDWEAETALSEGLLRLKDASVASNFTARVLEAAARAESRRSSWRWSWHSIWPKAAIAALAIALGIFSYEHHRLAERAEMAHSAAAISSMAVMSDPDILKNFETIRRLDHLDKVGPDETLIALMTQHAPSRDQ